MLSVKPWPTNPPRNIDIASLGIFPSRLRNLPRFFSPQSRVAVFVDARRLAAPPGRKVPKPPPWLCVGWNCDANRFLFNASATHHPRRGVLGVLAPSGRHVPGALAGWAQKVAKKSAGHVPRKPCFLATELQGCSEVLLCSARGRPLAPACADAWRDRSNALHSANDTDVANSLEHASRNHPKKSPS